MCILILSDYFAFIAIKQKGFRVQKKIEVALLKRIFFLMLT